MNMFESRPSFAALVLVNKDVAKPSIVAEVHNAITIGPKNCSKLTFAKQRHIGYMMRAFNNDFVRTGAAPDLVVLASCPKSTAIRHEGGILVGHHANGPVG